jgi:hypothetical protein
MLINKVRGRGEQPMWQGFASKNNDNQTTMFLLVVVFNKGGILLDT